MTTMVPLDAMGTLANNPYSDYPALIHMWNATDVAAGSNNCKDQIGSSNVSFNTATAVVAGISYDVATSGASVAENPFSNYAGKSILQVTMADMGTINGWSQLGDYIGNNAVAILATAGTVLAGSIASNETAVLVPDAEVQMLAVGYVPGDKVSGYKLKADGTWSVTSANVTTPASVDLADKVSMLNLGKWHGTAFFAFDTLPSDAETQEALSWMRHQWALGNHVIYPAWIGKV